MQCKYSPPWFSVALPPYLPVHCSKSKLSVAQSQNANESAKIYLPHHVNSITSTANPFVKHCIKLRNSSSYRHSHGLVIVVGSTPIREIYRFQDSLQEKTIEMEFLLLLDEIEVPEGLDVAPVRKVLVNSIVMKKISGLQSTESIDAIAVMRLPTNYLNVDDDCRRWFMSHHRILALEGIQDPGNLGTLLRSAVAFGWDGVFLLPGCCDPFNDKALRASRGASFQIPIISGTWGHLEKLKNELQMKMLAGNPESEEELKPTSRLFPELAKSLADLPLCLVLGSEGSGLSKKSQKICELVSIPMAGEFESLNVSVAGGIFLYMLQPEIKSFLNSFILRISIAHRDVKLETHGRNFVGFIQ